MSSRCNKCGVALPRERHLPKHCGYACFMADDEVPGFLKLDYANEDKLYLTEEEVLGEKQVYDDGAEAVDPDNLAEHYCRTGEFIPDPDAWSGRVGLAIGRVMRFLTLPGLLIVIIVALNGCPDSG